jgi:hypothetical protein
MALVLADRVLETTTTAGSGTITLAGAEPGYQSFSAVGNGNQTYYTITADTAWEVGIGTYTASGTTLSRDMVLSSSANGAKVTLSAGTKNVFVTYPSEKSVNRNVSGNISVSSAVITDVGYPNADSDAATKSYVDNMTTAALHIHTPVVLATPGSTGRTDTYNNGTAGVSATLTATANGTLTIDSTVAQATQRVLIKDCTNQVGNGVYVVTTVGDGSTAYVMTRAADADTYGEQGADSLDEGSYFFVTGGTSQEGAAFVCNTPGVIVFGSTNITFAQFSQAQVYDAGVGISLTGTTISLVSPVVVSNGGTGLTSTPTNGQLLIGNGTNYTLSTLTAGSGVSITNSAGSITLSATGLGGTVTAVTATGPLASSGGTTPDISIANTTGTGSVVLENSPSIFSATITAALSASITTITGSSANITTVTGTTAGFSSANITQLQSTSATITTLSGTNVTYSSGTITQFGATSATIATVSGTNVTYSNGSFTSATVTNLSSTSANITTLTGTTFGTTGTTQLRGASGAITNLTGTNLSYGSATITTGNLNFSGTGQRITGDFTNATATNRLAFQTTTANNATRLMVLPSGTGIQSAINFCDASDPTNCSAANISINGGTDMRLQSTTFGTGTALPMTFYTGGSERYRLGTAGQLGIAGANYGTSGQVLTSGGASAAPSWQTPTTVNNGTLTMAVSGTGLSGSQTFTANQSGNATFTVTSNATSANTGSTIVARDGGGSFSAGTITATLSGNASTVTDGMYLASTQTSGGRKSFSASQNVGSMLTATGSLGGLELYGGGGSNAAFMAFHRPGAYASYFGLDNDNQFAVGGWSIGAALAFFKCQGLGVGTAASATNGEIRATNNVTAYYSDARLKDFKGKIGDALHKINQLNGYYYTENEKAEEFGFKNKELQVGVSAQEVNAIMPEVIAPAPFDMDAENKSKSGENYMTVRYEKLVPLLIEAIKELKAEVEALKGAK